MPKQRQIIIVAGPNGAGKTTFAREYLLKEAHCPDFVNVDLIAAGLSPFDPDRAAIRAGRIMLSEIQRRTRKGESFAFETTLSGHVLRAVNSEMATGGLPCTAHISEFAESRDGDSARGRTGQTRWPQR